ncbi:peptide transporter family 1-like [Neocloeon triangulifer]|uniref:peptide transporter family 1-like n=1 Tax=Neocloeon triangulifer TaxID=2078957 RepID=UPI00286F0879|nr:peptide transporter family 1-like [Neocloeon triangulifer]
MSVKENEDSVSRKSIESVEKQEKSPEVYDGPPLKYPKSVFFIITNEFCERFCYYGMRTILALYLTDWLLYSEDTATVVYHAYIVLCYFTPILGAIIADSWLGRFKTILILSLVYAVGSVSISMSAIPDFIPPEAFTYVGLVLIGLGTGGIKPCVSAFGGDQFVVPAQEKQLQKYFSVFYLAINGGSLVSTFITPILREDVECFGRDDCYSLAFGVPAILMLVSIVIFVAGKPLYKCKEPEGNIVLQVCKCIGHGIVMRVKNRKEKKEHWLDHAADKYDQKLIHDVKLALRILFMFLTVPIFWALYDQQGSRWTFQATRMDGQLGEIVIKPDQMQVVNPIMIVVLIPVFEVAVYPLFKKLNILQKPLTKMGVGGCLAGLAFVISALVELAIKPSAAILPVSGEAQLRIYNTINCPIIISATGAVTIDEFEISPLASWERLHIAAQDAGQTFTLVAQPSDSCDSGINLRNFNVEIRGNTAQNYVLHNGIGASTQISLTARFEDSPDKNRDGTGKVRVVVNPIDSGNNVVQFLGARGYTFTVDQNTLESEIQNLEADDYEVFLNSERIGSTHLVKGGGVYTFLFDEETPTILSRQIVTPENNVNMMWLIPQYFIMTTGEILFSVTGLEFAFTQAPLTMKSVMVAGWYIAVAVGNLVVIFVAEAKIFEEQMYEYLLFAGLMFAGMIILFIQAWGYKYVTIATEESEDNLKKLEDKRSSISSEHKHE